MQLYRRAVYGDLLDLNLLDTRQYRTNQPCNERWASTCDGVNDAAAEVLGQAQEAWLFQSLQGSRARWKALAQQVMLMDLNRNLNGEVGYNLDTWAGYRVPRARLLNHIQRRNIDNVVVLTGDEHQNYAGELFLDGRNPEGRAIATEFVTTSISSSGDGVDQRSDMARIQGQTAASLEQTLAVINAMTGSSDNATDTGTAAPTWWEQFAATQSATATTAANDSQSALLEELQALRQEVSDLRGEQRIASAAIASGTSKTARILERVTPDGDAMATRSAP
ncbi:MAG: hypothetical protein B7Z20_10430 [Sphingobium sp. 32-64-5]|nr:MAG: hypothetical protein B7Z20_10430 [Sphingobium sp. 32-64-5]